MDRVRAKLLVSLVRDSDLERAIDRWASLGALTVALVAGGLVIVLF
jgi:hypothetical protein